MTYKQKENNIALGQLSHPTSQFNSVQSLSRVRLFVTPQTAARQACSRTTLSICGVHLGAPLHLHTSIFISTFLLPQLAQPGFWLCGPLSASFSGLAVLQGWEVSVSFTPIRCPPMSGHRYWMLGNLKTAVNTEAFAMSSPRVPKGECWQWKVILRTGVAGMTNIAGGQQVGGQKGEGSGDTSPQGSGLHTHPFPAPSSPTVDVQTPASDCPAFCLSF